MAKLEEKHYEYFRNEEFLEKYKTLLQNRLTFSNNKLEEDGLKIDELYAAEHADTLDDNIEALGIVFEQVKFMYDLWESFKKTTDIEKKKKLSELIKNNRKLTEDFIIDIANTINQNAANGFLSKGYRTIDNDVMFDGKYPIEKSKNISKKMKELLDNYYGPWSELDVFEREAKFNIEFLRIHPFDDGNGRTSRLLLNYNLLLQGHAPVLLPSKVKKKYFDARNKEDVQWIKNLFEKESEKELKVINHLIDKLINKYNAESERGYTL